MKGKLHISILMVGLFSFSSAQAGLKDYIKDYMENYYITMVTPDYVGTSQTIRPKMAASTVSELLAIFAMGNQNPNIIKACAMLNGGVDFSGIILLHNLKLIPLLTKCFFTPQNIKKLAQAEQLAQYNKKTGRTLKKEKFLQLLWLAANTVVKAIVTEMYTHHMKHSWPLLSRPQLFTVVINTLVDISEFFRRKWRYCVDFGQFEQMVPEQATPSQGEPTSTDEQNLDNKPVQPQANGQDLTQDSDGTIVTDEPVISDELMVPDGEEDAIPLEDDEFLAFLE